MYVDRREKERKRDRDRETVCASALWTCLCESKIEEREREKEFVCLCVGAVDLSVSVERIISCLYARTCVCSGSLRMSELSKTIYGSRHSFYSVTAQRLPRGPLYERACHARDTRP